MSNKKNSTGQIGNENIWFFHSPISKKAQIGDTMTWVVATLIIILVLTTFTYASGIFGKAKEVTIEQVSSVSIKNPVKSIGLLKPGEKTSGYEKESEIWTYSTDKSLFAYAISNSEDERKIIYQDLNSRGENVEEKINLIKIN
jgi:hypothetical protein